MGNPTPVVIAFLYLGNWLLLQEGGRERRRERRRESEEEGWGEGRRRKRRIGPEKSWRERMQKPEPVFQLPESSWGQG